MTDYDAWLKTVRAAIADKNKSAVARWLSDRMGTPFPSTLVKLHRLLSGQVTYADFACAVNAWIEDGCPEPLAERKGYTGKAGGNARASVLSPKRRSEIARNARAARTRKAKTKVAPDPA